MAQRVSELVGVTPTEGPSGRQIEWFSLTSEDDTAWQATLERAEPDVAAGVVGAFADLKFPDGTPIGGCFFDDYDAEKMYCLSRNQPTTLTRDNCCGDTIVTFSKSGLDPVFFDLLTPLRTLLVASRDLTVAEGATVYPGSVYLPYYQHGYNQSFVGVLVAFTYGSEALTAAGGRSGTSQNDWGITCLNLFKGSDGTFSSAEPCSNRDGNLAVLGYRDLGTLSNVPTDSLWKIQYDPFSRVSNWDRATITGMDAFSTMYDGQERRLIAFSNKYQSEVVIINDPWAGPGGVEILQRFGSPPIMVNPTGVVFGYHNMGMNLPLQGQTFQPLPWGFSSPWYTEYSNTGTIAVICNSGPYEKAKIFEFAIKLVPISSVTEIETGTNAVWITDYKEIDLEIGIPENGGARPIAQGLYVVSTGSSEDFKGIMIVDDNGGSLRASLDQNGPSVGRLTDGFVFVDLKAPLSSSKVARKFSRRLMART